MLLQSDYSKVIFLKHTFALALLCLKSFNDSQFPKGHYIYTILNMAFIFRK